MNAIPHKTGKGFTLIELLIVVVIMGILAMIAIPNVISAQRKTRYSRAASDTKVATTQALLYATDRNVYPTSIQVIRDAMLTNVSDVDPWGNSYILCPALTGALSPAVTGDVYIYSTGANAAGSYPDPFITNTGPGGSVGYSSVYGVWMGS